MNNDVWQRLLKAINDQIPDKPDRAKAQIILTEVFKSYKDFGLEIRTPEKCDFHELIFVFKKYISLKQLILLFQTLVRGSVTAVVDPVVPDRVRIVLKLIKNATETDADDAKKSKPRLDIPVDEDIKSRLWMSNEDRENFDVVASYGINIGPNQCKVEFNVLDKDSSEFIVVCNHVSEIDLSHYYWMMKDIGINNVVAIELLSANSAFQKPCSLDVTLKHIGSPPDARQEEEDDEQEEMEDDEDRDDDAEEDAKETKRSNTERRSDRLRIKRNRNSIAKQDNRSKTARATKSKLTVPPSPPTNAWSLSRLLPNWFS